MHYGRNTDPARLGERFQTCRNIDTIAVDVVAINDDVTDVDANAKVDPLIGHHVAQKLTRTNSSGPAMDSTRRPGVLCVTDSKLARVYE